MSKHDLPARPIFHHTHDATWAHLTVVMAALALARHLQETTGTVFMFYIREKRFWLLFEPNGIRFAMSSSRHERDLQREFPEHLQGLKRLAEDLNHDANHRQH